MSMASLNRSARASGPSFQARRSLAFSATQAPPLQMQGGGPVDAPKMPQKHQENWRKRKNMQENEDFSQANLGLMFDLWEVS